ncbi:hypothetical protein WJX84_004857 [Apatococcus fuscideae]|uniref:Uncharacterized protein n=1 Tax=Apatococcus fuscideae TaxID=2026836 RepID=A0AAW1TLF1_9CHLO
MMEARNWSIDPTGIVIPLILYSDASLNIGSANAFHPVMVALGSLPRRRLRKSCNHLLRIAHLPVLDKKALSSSDAEFTEMKRAVLHLVLDEDELVKAMGYRYQVAMWSAEWTAGGLREQNWTPERAVHSTGMSLHSGRPKTCCRAEAFCGLGRHLLQASGTQTATSWCTLTDSTRIARSTAAESAFPLKCLPSALVGIDTALVKLIASYLDFLRLRDLHRPTDATILLLQAALKRFCT